MQSLASNTGPLAARERQTRAAGRELQSLTGSHRTWSIPLRRNLSPMTRLSQLADAGQRNQGDVLVKSGKSATLIVINVSMPCGSMVATTFASCICLPVQEITSGRSSSRSAGGALRAWAQQRRVEDRGRSLPV